MGTRHNPPLCVKGNNDIEEQLRASDSFKSVDNAVSRMYNRFHFISFHLKPSP